jgi:hypothetical protein
LTGDKQLIYIPSLELAGIVANLAISDLSEGTAHLAPVAQPILLQSMSFLESGYSEAELSSGLPSAGWTNDQARQPDVVESWSTALALQIVLRTRRIVRRMEQFRILQTYRVKNPERPRKEWLRWPDLAGPIALVRSHEEEEQRARKSLRRISDPSSSGAVSRAVWTDIVRPALRDPFDRPQDVSSFLIYGPPGTRKSSLVGAVANALDWHLVTLAPPDFLRDGIAGFEARAEQIFADLLRLRRVVAFFDECEELFRRRTVVNSPEHRTQSDFITSGMLPRLQDLSQSRWIVFAIATNTELDEIDPAVVRFGRVDAQQRIGHPDVGAQIRYLKTIEVPESLLPAITAVLVSYDRYLDAEIEPVCRISLGESRRKAAKSYTENGELQEYFREVDRLRAQEAELPAVTFAVLDRFAKRMSSEKTAPPANVILDLLKAICHTKGRPIPWTELYGDDSSSEVM